MPSRQEQRESIYLPMYLMGLAFVLLNVYWFSFRLFYELGWYHQVSNELITKIMRSGLFDHYYTAKVYAFVFAFMCSILRHGKFIDTPWKTLIIWAVVSLAVFFIPPYNDIQYLFTTLVSYPSLCVAIAHIGRKFQGMEKADNDPLETFEQEQRKIDTETSINIPTTYQYRHKLHKGWLNIIQPQRAVIILGVPGSGKTFAVYGPIIEQFLAKGFPMFVYDYKYPSLTQKVYTEFMAVKDDFEKKRGRKVNFNVLNFKDPRMSMRCNPMHPRYLPSQEDASEIADLIWSNVNPSSVEKSDDFFVQSAKQYIDALIWFLRIHRDGKYCTFPHLIELMGRNYKAVFKMLLKHEEIRVKIAPFMNALQGNAMEQLMGQIATAQIALGRFASPALYWVLSGDDFPLDFNNPDAPSIICMGNDPDRQTLYGTTLALITSRMFRKINHKKSDTGKLNLPCGVLLDELPTIFLRGLDQLIATARENKVCIFLGAQDKSQLIRDYKDKEADVILNTVGTVVSGQVNGKTAKDMSEMFGKEFRRQQSETSGGENDTINTSYQLHELLPQSRIETMSQGYFFGKVADDFDHPIKRKLFNAKLMIDVEAQARKAKNAPDLPNFDDKFGLDVVEAEVRQNIDLAAVQYIQQTQVLPEEWEKERADRGYERMTDAMLLREADRRYKELQKKGKDAVEALEREVIEWKKNETVADIIKKNYYAIKTDILEIFEDEGVEEYEDEEGGEPANNGPAQVPTNTRPVSTSGGGTPSGTRGGAGKPAGDPDGGPAVPADDIEPAEAGSIF